MNTKKLDELHVLVVGLGSIGVRHLTNLRRLGCGNLGAFRSLNRPLHKQIDLHGITLHDDFEEALRQGYDAVVICNPTSLHLEYAQRAAEAGCHLYIEKPVSHTLQNSDKLLQTVKKNKLAVMVGCQFRFHPNLITIKNWLDQKAVGRILSVQVDTGEYLPGWHPWEDYRKSYAGRSDMGGGVILTLIHEFDYLHWFFGPIQSVYAMGGQLTPLEIDVEDTALISMRTKEGVPIQLRMDYWRNPPVRKMHIIGEKGEIFWDYYQGEAVLHQTGSSILRMPVPDKWERNNLFLSIMRNFLEAIENQKLPSVLLSEGIEVLKIALAAKTSLTENEVIHL